MLIAVAWRHNQFNGPGDIAIPFFGCLLAHTSQTGPIRRSGRRPRRFPRSSLTSASRLCADGDFAERMLVYHSLAVPECTAQAATRRRPGH